MPNLFDYIAWRGDLTFEAAPFSEVDNLIFSMLSFTNFDGIVSGEVLGVPVKLSECLARHRELYPNGEDFGKIIPDETGTLFVRAAESVRFRDVYVTFYRSETNEERYTQFAAVTFILPDNTLFVAFRGTDDTLVGWREDFNLSFMHPGPGQLMAVDYLTEIASVYGGRIRTGGHSKGGHLAVYAATFSPKAVRDRVITAYSNDGPGFVREVIESAEFREMSDRICTFVPQASIIGMLLEHKEDYVVIESTVSNLNGLRQHDPFSWSVVGPSFVHLDGLSREGRRTDEVIDRWLEGVSPEDRRRFTETVFGLLEATGAKTLSDLSVDHVSKIGAAIRAFGELDRESKEGMISLVKRLATAGRRKNKESGE